MKNNSHRYDINRPRPRHEHNYTKYKMCHVFLYNGGYMFKQHLSNILVSIHKKVKQHWGWIEKKRYLWRKSVNIKNSVLKC